MPLFNQLARQFNRQLKPFHRKALVFSIGASLALTAGIGYHYSTKQQQQKKPDSLWNVLDYYGFNQSEQKQALELIMQRAGIIEPTGSFMDIFPPRDSDALLFEDILKFVELTQKHFTVRTGTQERWEVQPGGWTKENQGDSLQALTTLGLVQEVTPTSPDSDVICVLGARMSAMATRMEYAGTLFNKDALKAQYLVLLAGERRVTVGVDGSEEDLLKIASKYQITDLAKLTETHLMREVYEHSNIFNKLPVDVIDTPAGNLPRPTTETTVQAFCKWLKAHPSVKQITFISNQPHVKYQEAIIAEVFKYEGIDYVKFEVVGSKVGPNAKIQELVGALGSQIWAQTPGVVSTIKINLGTVDNSLIDVFRDLYRKQPLVYSNIQFFLSQEELHPVTKPRI